MSTKNRLSHYEWLNKNYEKFCKNSGYRYFPGAVSAHGDKLSRLQYHCEDNDVPFYKVAAIALATWYQNDKLMCDGSKFEDECIRLYKENPEWYDGCGGIEDAEVMW